MYKKAVKILLTGAGAFFVVIVSLVLWVYFKQQSIIDQAKKSIESSINGELEIGSFQFRPFGRNPGLTFSLSDIRLKDSLYHLYKTPLTEISRLDVTFSLETIFLMNIRVRDIRISDSKVFVFVRRDGYSNLSIFPSHGSDDKKAHSAGRNLFGKIKLIRLDNVSLTYADSLKEKYHGATLKRVSGSYTALESGWRARLKGPVAVEKLVFNNAKGAFLKNSDIHLAATAEFNNKTKDLEILPETYIQLENHERINVSGLLSTSPPHGPMKLRFQTDRIRVPVATSVLSDTLAMKIDRIGIDTYTSADVTVNGNLGEPNPWVIVHFKTDTFSYETPVGYFRGVKTGGYFDNRADTLLKPSPANSKIKSGRITGFFEKVPVKGSLQIEDLTNPLAKISLHVRSGATGLNSLLDTGKYKVTAGGVSLDLYFDGRLKTLYNSETDELDGRLRGKAVTYGLAIAYLPRNVRLSRIESNITLTQDQILIDRLNLYDNQNQLYIKGKLSRYLHHLLGSPQPAKAKIDIDIPKWKLNWIEVLVNSAQNSQGKGSQQKFSRLIDQLMANLDVDASLKAGQLSYHNFKARNVTGKLTMSGDVTDISTLSLDAFGGHATLSGKMRAPGRDASYASIEASGRISKADVSQILYSFNDFGQKALSSKNVRGQLDLNFRFSSRVKPDVSLVPQSMNGYLDMHFSNGQLINFEPFLKVKKIIFKNRPLEHVKIAPIRRRFTLKGQEVRIPKMQIESNVLTLFLEGQYSFGDKTDLSIQLPLKNLKKRDEEYEFQTYDADGLRSVFLRAVEEDGEVNIKLDSRKRARKRTYSDSTTREQEAP